jgi:hypothetical protein
MRYIYYKSKGWNGRGHIEEIDWNKKRKEKEKTEANKTKNNEPEQEEVLINIAKIERVRGVEGEYQYDMG